MCASKTDLELYIHIPFCIKKCNYCDFLSFPSNEERREIYVQSLAKKLQQKGGHVTQFITTRFGNVLGSNGSVIPRFRDQIQRGGPVTVTHPEIIS